MEMLTGMWDPCEQARGVCGLYVGQVTVQHPSLVNVPENMPKTN